MAIHIDPVCGMKVGDGSSLLQARFERRDYHFCTRECKEKFEENPQAYIKTVRV